MHRTPRTAEHVSEGHPDKFCDQVGDRILDEVLNLAGSDDKARQSVRTAIECLAKDNILIVSGEANLPGDCSSVDIERLGHEVWKGIGYSDDAHELTVLDHVRSQSKNIAAGVDSGGAGDQGIMVGYATDETAELMPQEWVFARDLCLKLSELRRSKTLPWLKSDCKSQVTMDGNGVVTRVTIAAQHEKPTVGHTSEDMEREVLSLAVDPLIVGGHPKEWKRIELKGVQQHYYVAERPAGKLHAIVNGTGAFEIGGPKGDCGVVGRKIVVDAYGPRIAVGGGCYSGKDPTKVDRSGAYMARYIAKTIVAERIADAKECTVTLAYTIGRHDPEMITAVTDKGTDLWPVLSMETRWKNLSLSPKHIIERFSLQKPVGWSYFQTASYGHYGRSLFPWEKAGRHR